MYGEADPPILECIKEVTSGLTSFPDVSGRVVNGGGGLKESIEDGLFEMPSQPTNSGRLALDMSGEKFLPGDSRLLRVENPAMRERVRV
jgi:hypothetical protein